MSWRGAGLLVAAGLLLLLGCRTPSGPTTVVNVYNNQSQSQGEGAGQVGEPPTLGCAGVASVGASARDQDNRVVGSGNTPGVLLVGQVYSLDATPKDANGAILPTNCHAPTGQWTALPEGRVELLGDVRGFNPQARARAPGDVVVSFTLGAGAGAGKSVDLRLRVQ